MRRRRLNPVARLLSMAKDSAGARAVAAAEREDHETARVWRALAVEIDRLVRDAVELLVVDRRCVYCGCEVRALETSTCRGCDDLPALEDAELRLLLRLESLHVARMVWAA